MAPIFAFWGTCKRGAATAVYDYAHFGERLLLRLLRTFDRTAARTGDWRAYTQYAPEVVMQTFRRVFLEAPCLPASSVGQ